MIRTSIPSKRYMYVCGCARDPVHVHIHTCTLYMYIYMYMYMCMYMYMYMCMYMYMYVYMSSVRHFLLVITTSHAISPTQVV